MTLRGHSTPYEWADLGEVYRTMTKGDHVVVLGKDGHKIGKSTVRDLPTDGGQLILVSDHVSRPAVSALVDIGCVVFSTSDVIVSPLALQGVPRVRTIEAEPGSERWPSIKQHDRLVRYLGLRVGQCIATDERQYYTVVE